MALMREDHPLAQKKPLTAQDFLPYVEVVFGDEAVPYVRTSEAKTVGEALMAEGLIAGEDGPYGLYVKTVDGLTLDYDKDGMYWAFYINGEYGMSGCELTNIEDGASYAFKAEK